MCVSTKTNVVLKSSHSRKTETNFGIVNWTWKIDYSCFSELVSLNKTCSTQTVKKYYTTRSGINQYSTTEWKNRSHVQQNAKFNWAMASNNVNPKAHRLKKSRSTKTGLVSSTLTNTIAQPARSQRLPRVTTQCRASTWSITIILEYNIKWLFNC